MIVNGYDIRLYTSGGSEITFDVIANGVNYNFDAQSEDFYFSTHYRSSLTIDLVNISVSAESVHRVTVTKDSVLLFEGLSVKEDITFIDNINFNDNIVYNISFTDYLAEFDKKYLQDPNVLNESNPNTGLTDWRYRFKKFEAFVNLMIDDVNADITLDLSYLSASILNVYEDDINGAEFDIKPYVDDNDTFLTFISEVSAFYRTSIFIQGRTLYLFEVSEDKPNFTFDQNNTFDEVEKIILPDTQYVVKNEATVNENSVYTSELKAGNPVGTNACYGLRQSTPADKSFLQSVANGTAFADRCYFLFDMSDDTLIGKTKNRYEFDLSMNITLNITHSDTANFGQWALRFDYWLMFYDPATFNHYCMNDDLGSWDYQFNVEMGGDYITPLDAFNSGFGDPSNINQLLSDLFQIPESSENISLDLNVKNRAEPVFNSVTVANGSYYIVYRTVEVQGIGTGFITGKSITVNDFKANFKISENGENDNDNKTKSFISWDESEKEAIDTKLHITDNTEVDTLVNMGMIKNSILDINDVNNRYNLSRSNIQRRVQGNSSDMFITPISDVFYKSERHMCTSYQYNLEDGSISATLLQL